MQEEALVDDQVRVADWPELIFVGLAASEAVVTGGGVVKEPVVHGVSGAPMAPQQVLKLSPLSGLEGLEVSPQGFCMMTPLADSDRFGLRPLASTALKVTWS